MRTLPRNFRVAYVCADPGVPAYGKKGCSGHVQEVIRALLAAGATVDLFATRMDEPPPQDLRVVPVHRLPAAPKGATSLREQQCLLANHSLQAALEQRGPFDMVYERSSLWSYAAMEYARRRGVPGVLEVNAPLIEEQIAYRELVNRDAAEEVAERSLEAASMVAAVSSGVMGYLRSKYPLAAGKSHIIPNGVNARRFHPNVPPCIARCEGLVTVGFVGHLKPWHGVEVLAEAFARLWPRQRNLRLLIVGDGPARKQLLEQLAQHRLPEEAVVLTGRVDREQVPALIASMDIATAPYPSLPNCYFSPLKLFEYWATGVPVVGSARGQLAELIENGVDGLLVAPGNPDALQDALAEMAHQPYLRQCLANRALSKVRREHTWDAVVGRVLELSGAVHTSPAAAVPLEA